MKKLILSALACMLLCTGAFSAEKGFLKGKILKIDMKEAIDERGGSSFNIGLGGISSSSAVSLLGVERALEKAAEDKEIAMIYLNIDHFFGSMSVVEEVRNYLKRFSAAGKPVVAWAAGLSNGSYYLGSVADRLFLHPQGGGTLNGLGSTQYFLKDLLDTLGVEVKLIRHGKFKSAGEMYIRNSMSPENRQQYQDILEASWSTMVEQMAASRGIEATQLRE